jgi:hypothetical protein
LAIFVARVMMLFMPTLRLPTCIVLLLILTACAFTRADEATPSPMPTARIIQTTPVPTIQREVHPVATPLPEATAAPSAIRCPAEWEGATAHYAITADVDYPKRTVAVQQQVEYVNRTNQSLEQLIMVVRPNSLPDQFAFKAASLAGGKLDAKVAGQRLTLELPEQLDSDCSITFTLEFVITIPEIDRESVNAYKGYLGHSYRQLNLGHWVPTMAVWQGDDWLMHDEIPIGEQDVLDDADWDMTLNVTGASDKLRIAAPGTIETDEPGHWRYTLLNARDFSLSMSEDYTVSTSETEGGVTVELYTFEDAMIQTDAGAINSAAFALDVATRSLNMYSDLYGEYPYKRLVVIQADFPDGMEFSGLVFVGGEYFRGFGGPTSYLMLITIHEVAHQWWYGRVGNDQALNPWLDEALATYSEYAFIEEYFPALKDWWWNFRVDNYSPEGFVDSTVYEFKTRREYINAIYLRGVRMLQDLRSDLGTDAFFDWLRRYAEAGAGRVVMPDFFWSLLTPEQFELTAQTREEYLRQPQIVVISPEATPSQ